jgi:predicted nucleotidyltransferase
MKVNAIIAEYNPFHNGHKYLLDNALKNNKADYTIVLMSGNFVQRGNPAILDKFDRTRMALSCGADLVLELPICYSASSAEFFATGAVSLLDKLGVVDTLCFGSECGDIELLGRIARILACEPEEFTSDLKENLALGHSYPNARTSALIHYDPELAESRMVLSSPNNILGIEYIKAILRLGSTISPYTTKRLGADYHDTRMGNTPTSASAIRVALVSGQNIEFMREHMPAESYEILQERAKKAPLIEPNSFSEMLYYKLLNEKKEGYTKYFDVSPDLSDRIVNHLDEFRSFDDFCNVLKSKEVTYTRISRCLLHILLGLTDDVFDKCRALEYTPYARVLGFRKDSSPLLTKIKMKSSIPLITKLADACDILSEDAYAMLENELRMNDIYLSAAALKSNSAIRNDFSTPLVIL